MIKNFQKIKTKFARDPINLDLYCYIVN